MSNRTFNLSLIILFAAYTIIACFLFPIKGLSFIISYLFTLIAFALQFALAYTLGDSKKVFNTLPIWTLASSYLIVQIIISIIFMALNIALIPVIVIQIIILAIVLVLEIFLSESKGHIETQEEFQFQQISFLENAIKEVEILVNSSNNKNLNELYETVRYANPVSSPNVVSIENNITNNIINLKDALNSDNKETIEELVQIIKEDFAEREILLKR